jgi:hypothetical protein
MRSLPAIFLAVLTAVVTGVSAFLTASHFGPRDWPNPPMPDTASRLITPTEAAGRTSDRGGDDGEILDVKVAADSLAGEARKADRRDRGARTSTRRGSRRSERRSRRSGNRRGERRAGNRGGDDRRPSNDAAPVTTPPANGGSDSTGTPGGVVPSPVEQTQARSPEPVAPVTEPPVTAEPIAPNVPSGESADDDDSTDESAGDRDDRPGRGRGRDRGRRGGLLGNLLSQLP